MLDSYILSKSQGSSNPRKQMMYEKERQVSFLYDMSPDREDETFLNGNPFVKSPRIFGRKFIDKTHHEITVETIDKDDWIECGDYLEYDNMIWLCLNSFSFHKLYCRATFMSCDWKLFWQDKNGEIKNIYVIDQNSTQYNSGESGNQHVTLGTAQHMLRMQCNEDTIVFDSPQRFAIDKNIKNPTCYKVTQNDNSSYNYGKGLCCVTVTENTLNPKVDKFIKLNTGEEVWICDYYSIGDNEEQDKPVEPLPDENNKYTVNISGSNKLKVGIPKKYTVSIYDMNNSSILSSTKFSWNVICTSEIKQSLSGDYNETLTLTVDDESLIGKSFITQIIINKAVVCEKTIDIIDLF